MKIRYYTDGKAEILLIKDNEGNIVKKGRYTMGNCLIDILTEDNIVSDNEVIRINKAIKNKAILLLDKCDDYLYNNIKSIIENDLSFIFENDFLYRNTFLENKLCQIHVFDNIHGLLCLLLTLVYTNKLMYKHCKNCNKLFATKYTNAKFCKRIATKSGKTCSYAYSLKMNKDKRKNKSC